MTMKEAQVVKPSREIWGVEPKVGDECDTRESKGARALLGSRPVAVNLQVGGVRNGAGGISEAGKGSDSADHRT